MPPIKQATGILAHQPVSAKDTALSTSLFKNNLLAPAGSGPAIHYTNYDYAVSLVLFISFVVFVWLYVSNRKRMNMLVKGFYTSKSSNQLSRDEYTASNRMGLILSLLFLLTITLFVGQVSNYYGLIFPGGKVIGYGIIVLGLIVLYAVKIITVQLSGFVFKTGKETADYISTLFVFINLLGLFMLPVVMCLAFFRQVSPAIFIYTGYAIILGFVCIRLIRGIVIGFNSNRVSKFYLFLYLCTLEIIPFILIVKLFILYV